MMRFDQPLLMRADDRWVRACRAGACSRRLCGIRRNPIPPSETNGTLAFPSGAGRHYVAGMFISYSIISLFTIKVNRLRGVLLKIGKQYGIIILYLTIRRLK